MEISCNSDGTVHWDATVHNGGSCEVTIDWKSRLQQRIEGRNRFTNSRTDRGEETLPPGDTHITGDFCRNFPDHIDAIRVVFSIDGDDDGDHGNGGGGGGEDECEDSFTSDSIAPCDHTGSCRGTSMGDVPEGQWYYKYVEYLLGMGVVSGYPGGTFHPNDSVTRGQLVKMVILAFDLPTKVKETHYFKDVQPGDIYYSYIQAAYSRRLVSGYKDGTFRPEAYVTRGQVAKIMVQAAGLQLVKPKKPTFRDVPQSADIYLYVETAYANSIFSGYADGTFRPSKNITRAQVCGVLYPFVANAEFK